MRLEKLFDVRCSREAAVAALACEETLLGLFPDTQTEVVARRDERVTLRSRYRALGQDGIATFHFEFEPGGDVRFEKVCDGRVWRWRRHLVPRAAPWRRMSPSCGPSRSRR